MLSGRLSGECTLFPFLAAQMLVARAAAVGVAESGMGAFTNVLVGVAL